MQDSGAAARQLPPAAGGVACGAAAGSSSRSLTRTSGQARRSRQRRTYSIAHIEAPADARWRLSVGDQLIGVVAAAAAAVRVWPRAPRPALVWCALAAAVAAADDI